MSIPIRRRPGAVFSVVDDETLTILESEIADDVDACWRAAEAWLGAQIDRMFSEGAEHYLRPRTTVRVATGTMRTSHPPVVGRDSPPQAYLPASRGGRQRGPPSRIVVRDNDSEEARRW